MRRKLGRCILALVAGWLLSRLRCQAGLDLLQWPAVDVQSAALERAIALGILAFFAWNVRFGLSALELMGIAIGYAAHGLFLGPPPSSDPFVFVLMAVLAFVAWRFTRGERDIVDEEGAQPANVGEMLGLFVAGAGVAVALESVARHVRLFGAGLAQDDSVFGATFLFLVAFGALAFGWMTRKSTWRRLSFPVLLGASAAACFLSLQLIDAMSDAHALDVFVRRWWLDASYHGTIGWDALIAGRIFVVPALVLGAALVGSRGRGSLMSALAGAASAILFFPRLLEAGAHADIGKAALFSAQFVPLASLVALAGATFAILCESKRRPRARYVAIALALPCGLPALLATVKPIYVISPWRNRPVLPFLALETPAGFVTVEPSDAQFKMATLDRHALSPTFSERGADAQRMRCSIDLLSPEKREKKDFKVLFVGQLTVLRANQLVRAGAATIDRSAAWSPAMRNLETELFKAQDNKPGMTPPPGEILAASAARERLTRGDYDLVIAPPIDSDAPMLSSVDVPKSTVVVRWLGTDQPLRAGEIPPATFIENGTTIERRVLVPAGPALDDLAFALVTNGFLAPEGDAGRPALLAIEPRSNAPAPIERLSLRRHVRTEASRLAIAERLERAAADEKARALAAGMRAHFAAQVQSSPFETAQQKVELDDEALDLFARAATQGPLDAFTRQLWEWIAWVLVGKRDVARIDRYLAPLAAAHPTWVYLEIALAHADIEGLEAGHAIERLTTLLQSEPQNVELLSVLGDAHQSAGDRPAAIAAWRRALTTAPDPSIRRKLAFALFAQGDLEARTLARELVAEYPDDDELRALLEAKPKADGPAPADAR